MLGVSLCPQKESAKKRLYASVCEYQEENLRNLGISLLSSLLRRKQQTLVSLTVKTTWSNK
jgi:hypothetical protein